MTGKKGAYPPWVSLTAVRESQGMTKVQLARRAEMNQSHVASVEKGYVRPRADSIKRIANVLGVPVSAIPLPPLPPTEGEVRTGRLADEEALISRIREVLREELDAYHERTHGGKGQVE